MSRRSYDAGQWMRGSTLKARLICQGCHQPIVRPGDHDKCAEAHLKALDASGENPTNQRRRTT